MISQLWLTASSSMSSPSRLASACARVSPTSGIARPNENERLVIAFPELS